jgi:putative ABC transport system permease protein
VETRWVRTLHLGLKSLMLHKLRSGLTALGIVFGVCSVIAMLAIGEGAQAKALHDIESLGANNVIVRSTKPIQEASNVTTESRVLEYGIQFADYDRLVATIPTLTEVLPIWELRKEIRHHDAVLDGRLVSTTPAYRKINRLGMYRGRFLSQTDMDRRENVAVLAFEVAQKLFPLKDPVGQRVKVQHDYYRVIGVCESRAPSAAIGGSLAAQEYDKDVYIPLSTARMRLGELQLEVRGGQMSFESTQLSQITLEVAHSGQIRKTAAVVQNLLARYHTKQKDYAVVVPLELLAQAERTKRLFSVVLGSVAGISLLVGGIGIMNIMLATVTERTREIGIRRAIGAKRRDITVQFLVETVVLSGVGGLLGLALGVGLAYLVERFAYLIGLPLPVEVTGFGRTVPFRWVIAAITGVLLGLAALAVALIRISKQGASARLAFQGAGMILVGVLSGTLMGVGLPYMITDMVEHMFKYSVPTIVNPWSIPVAFIISLGIGVFFGIYPARRAAMMDPIEALRHD